MNIKQRKIKIFLQK